MPAALLPDPDVPAPSPPDPGPAGANGPGATLLTRPLTPLLARETEVAMVAGLLRDSAVRLLTLTGPGGVGKTRLAMAVAASVATGFPDGSWIVDLTALTDPGLVGPTIASTVGLRDIGADSIQSRLISTLADRRALLVLDNFEHVVTAGPQLTSLLRSCPRVTLLITSRISLRLSGEREFALGPLPLTTAAGDPDPPGAIRLFVERARAVQPDFQLTAATLPVVTEIVRRVDGLPLAIELAAARTRALPPPALLARLERRLPLLSGGARDLPLRQQTMRDTIRWSYDLLSPADQLLFRRLAVFSGGFTLAAATGVATDPGDDDATAAAELATVDGITSLLEQSVVHQHLTTSPEPRFTMLETVREFAREQLERSGESEQVRRRHAAYFLAMATTAGGHLIGPFQVAASLDQLASEQDNLRAAMDWLDRANEPEALLRLAQSLWVFWNFRGPYAEGRARLERAVARGGETLPLVRHEVLYGLGLLAVNQDDVVRAESCFTESLAIAESHANPAGAAYSWFGLGLVAMHQHQYGAAVLRLEAVVTSARRVADRALGAVREGLALSFLGAAAYAQGNLALAARHFEAALANQRAVDHRWGLGFSLLGLGYVIRDRHDPARALAHFRDGLAVFTELDDRRMLALALDGVAGVCISEHQLTPAIRLLGAAAALREADGFPVEPAFLPAYERSLAAARAATDDAAFTALWAAGAALTRAEATASAVAIVAATTAATPDPAVTPPSHADRLGLTSREVEVLRCLAAGMSDRDIAATLSISERTAGNHVQNVMRKIEVESRTAAAVYAVRHGLD